MGLGLVRAGAVVALFLVIALVARRWKATWRGLREFFLEPSSPVNVGLLRIVVFYAMWKIALRHQAVWYAGLAREIRVAPFGWEWAVHSRFFEPEWLSIAQSMLIVASACATLGIFTRVSVPVATVLAIYGHAVATFFGKVNHGGHAGMLCALVLCFSACGDALSVNRAFRWFRRQPAPAPSAAYGLPMRSSWLLLGTSYLFPGLWKLWVGGDAWITGRRLRETLRGRWENLESFTPPLRLDEWPVLLAFLGTATLLFEIGFLFALFHRRTRIVAAFAAVGFHLGIKHFLRITFPPYLPLIVLFDFPQIGALAKRGLPTRIRRAAGEWRARAQTTLERFGERLRGHGPPGPHPLRSALVPAIGATLLVSAQLGAGTFRMNSWPISVFPTFMNPNVRAPKVGASLRIVHEPQGGESSDLEQALKRMGPATLRRLFRRLTGALPTDPNAGRGIVNLFESVGVPVHPGDGLAFYRATWSLDSPGEQNGYRERLVRRYAVTADRSLALEYDARRERRSTKGKAKSASDRKGKLAAKAKHPRAKRKKKR